MTINLNELKKETKNMPKLKNVLRNNVYCDQCYKYIGVERIAYFSDNDKDLDFCSKDCYSVWKKLENAHKNFTFELIKEWRYRGFSCEQCQKWMELGLEPNEFVFAFCLTEQGYQPQGNLNLEELRKKYYEESQKNQEWLDRNYPKETRSQTWEVYLNEPSLKGELDLGRDFASTDIQNYLYPYRPLVLDLLHSFCRVELDIGKMLDIGEMHDLVVFISSRVDETKLTIKNLTKYDRIIKLKNVQEWLDKEYPTKEEREKVIELDISNEEIEGDLDLSGFTNLKILHCSEDELALPVNKLTSLNISNCQELREFWCSGNLLTNLDISKNHELTELKCCNNLLTDIVLPTNPANLKYLDLRGNKFPEQGLSFLSPYINLEVLSLAGNTFTGSLEPLKNLTKLKIVNVSGNKITGSLNFLSEMKQLAILNISNTDINKVDVNNLPTSLADFYYFTELGSSYQLTAIVPQLDFWTWKDLHSAFEPSYRREWEKLLFSKEQTKEWIQAGLEPYDYRFASYLRDAEKLSPERVSNNKEKEEYQEIRKRCNEFDWCRNCQQPNNSENWCQPCHEKEWKEELEKLVENKQKLVEKFVQQQQQLGKNSEQNFRQLRESSKSNLVIRDNSESELKWISYSEFTNIEYLTEGGFSKIYKAAWKKGEHDGKDEIVILKSINDSKNNTLLEFLTETVNASLIYSCRASLNEYPSRIGSLFRGNFREHGRIVQCYGISQDPSTENYVMVMQYMEDGNLRQCLQKQDYRLSLSSKLWDLSCIAGGLVDIHGHGLFHCDFHSGNILKGSVSADYYISDLGLCRPANEKNREVKYGVLPYVAPEVLQGEPYTQTSDIYSFGIVAYELLAQTYPYPEIDDNTDLVIKVCQGYRPNLDEVKIPQLLKDLIKRCWNTDPNKRPNASELTEIIDSWRDEVNEWDEEINGKKDTEFSKQYHEIEPEYDTFSKNNPYKMPSAAVTHSKLIKTQQIVQLFQESEKQALEQEIKKIEKEINQPLTDELKELVKSFTQARKKMIKNEGNEKLKNKALELEDQLLDEKGLLEENIEKIINYCKRFVGSEDQSEQNIKKGLTPSTKENWTNINSDFTPELVQEWKNYNFTYEQCREWINISPFNQQNVAIKEPAYYAWLRDMKKMKPEEVLNYGDSKELNREFFECYQQQFQAQIEINAKK